MMPEEDEEGAVEQEEEEEPNSRAKRKEARLNFIAPSLPTAFFFFF